MLWIDIQAKNELNRLQNSAGKQYSTYSLNELVKEKNLRYKK